MTQQTANTPYPTWTNRWTFVLAATGSAVGLGNIWKFPYITGEYGGGAFVLVYLICILLVGIPVMIAEVMLGRAGRLDPIQSMVKLGREEKTGGMWVVIGAMGVLAGLMILMFYSVVAGWALEFTYKSATGGYAELEPEQIKQQFGALTDNFNLQLFWHTLFVLITGGVLAAGVMKGIARTVEILMPSLFVLLIILLVYSYNVGDGAKAFHFMFDFNFSKLSGEAVLVALGHAFFTLSLGMGAVMVYGSYMPAENSLGKMVLLVAFLDTAVALVAGLAIFPLVFGNGLQPSSGPGLMFQSLPIAFAEMPLGMVFGTLFFALVSIAALSSAISLIEPGIAWLERKGVHRFAGTGLMTLLAWLGGVASIHSGDVFDFLDKATAQFMLPLGGLLIAVFVGWRMSAERVHAEVRMGSQLLFDAWRITLRYVAPLAIILVFLNSLGWLDPIIHALHEFTHLLGFA